MADESEWEADSVADEHARRACRDANLAFDLVPLVAAFLKAECLRYATSRSYHIPTCMLFRGLGTKTMDQTPTSWQLLGGLSSCRREVVEAFRRKIGNSRSPCKDSPPLPKKSGLENF